MENIQEIINREIAGQGNQVDIAGALPKVLTVIVENAKFNKSAKITVNVKGYKVNDAEDGFDANAGATGTVIVKGFNEAGETLPVQEVAITLDEEGEANVEVEANIGDTIGVMAKIDGSGATCQMVQKVVGDVTIPVDSYPEGIWEMGDGYLNYSAGNDMFYGTCIITADFALILPPYQRAGWKNKQVSWGGMFQHIPFVKKAANVDEAITDVDGALNTAAIMSVVSGDCAARTATIDEQPNYTRINPFLPSAGMLKYLYDHKAEINQFIDGENDAYSPETEYDKIPDLYVWSSTDTDPATTDNMAASAWYVGLDDGYVSHSYRSNDSCVLSVSAFQTRY